MSGAATGGALINLISHMCAKMESTMKTFLLFLLVLLLCLLWPRLGRTLRALPKRNDDFVLF